MNRLTVNHSSILSTVFDINRWITCANCTHSQSGVWTIH